MFLEYFVLAEITVINYTCSISIEMYFRSGDSYILPISSLLSRYDAAVLLTRIITLIAKMHPYVCVCVFAAWNYLCLFRLHGAYLYPFAYVDYS